VTALAVTVLAVDFMALTVVLPGDGVIITASTPIGTITPTTTAFLTDTDQGPDMVRYTVWQAASFSTARSTAPGSPVMSSAIRTCASVSLSDLRIDVYGTRWRRELTITVEKMAAEIDDREFLT
jgi:hypothetical protein